jgi:hypothetical protein
MTKAQSTKPTGDNRWVRLYDGTRQLNYETAFGRACIYEYTPGESYRASVSGAGNPEIHTDSLADAYFFCEHPFRVLTPGDYWLGSQIIGRTVRAEMNR